MVFRISGALHPLYIDQPRMTFPDSDPLNHEACNVLHGDLDGDARYAKT
jgi:hypothetical protein